MAESPWFVRNFAGEYTSFSKLISHGFPIHSAYIQILNTGLGSLCFFLQRVFNSTAKLLDFDPGMDDLNHWIGLRDNLQGKKIPSGYVKITTENHHL